jgi:hypothetical protein
MTFMPKVKFLATSPGLGVALFVMDKSAIGSANAAVAATINDGNNALAECNSHLFFMHMFFLLFSASKPVDTGRQCRLHGGQPRWLGVNQANERRRHRLLRYVWVSNAAAR